MIKADSYLITASDPKSIASEAYRSLRTSLQFALNSKIKTMLVTSTVQGEGKTTTLVNLGVTLAQAGTRTLLIEADLRRPMFAQVFNLQGRKGLSHALTGEPLEHCIQDSGIGKLRVVTAGMIPPNPAELLGSGRMGEVVEAARKEADLVLIDSPPVLVVTDAVILSALTESVLLVVRQGETRKDALIDAVQKLRGAGANMIGVVMNNVTLSEGKSYYYSRYYRYESKVAQ